MKKIVYVALWILLIITVIAAFVELANTRNLYRPAKIPAAEYKR